MHAQDLLRVLDTLSLLVRSGVRRRGLEAERSRESSFGVESFTCGQPLYICCQIRSFHRTATYRCFPNNLRGCEGVWFRRVLVGNYSFRRVPVLPQAQVIWKSEPAYRNSRALKSPLLRCEQWLTRRRHRNDTSRPPPTMYHKNQHIPAFVRPVVVSVVVSWEKSRTSRPFRGEPANFLVAQTLSRRRM